MSAVGMPPPVGLAPLDGAGAIGSLAPEVTRKPDSIPFASVLGGMLEAANSAQFRADAASAAFAAGKSDDIHGTMIAVKEAEISTRLTATVRNKLLDAFYELWRMSV